MANILEINNVTKTFRGGVLAVDDVTLGVEEGEFLTILGPSGCGKTTTLRMVGGFEYPDAGQILLDGQDVTDLPPHKRPVNMMFQDFALFPHMTVAQNIGYGLTIAGVKKSEIKSEVEEALRTIELSDKADRRPAELSIGQKQRVALARALVRRPKILLLDEPMSALDAKLREAMQIELKRLHDQIGLTFVMVTHDQTEALVMSDRIVVMESGRIVQIGAPAELYEQPKTPYVANFIGTSNMIVGNVAEVTGDTALVRFDGTDIRAMVRGSAPVVGDTVTLSIRPEKVKLHEAGEEAGRKSAASNILRGKLRDKFFHGESVRLAIDIGSDQLFFVHRQLEAGLDQMALPEIGADVTLGVDAANIILFAGAREVSPDADV
jgi:putative spermidine/putrescine transport system ATP-binding protein/spermidine/putrescine transport system ATP-binding protein